MTRSSILTLSPEQITRLHRRVESLTARPSGVPSKAPPNVIIVVPPGGLLADGFALARTQRGRVRIIAHGATFERSWPSWVREAPDVELTELGAYALESRVTPWSRAIASGLRPWLVDLLPSAFDDLSAADVLVANALPRILNLDNDPSMFAHGLASLHRDAALICTESGWLGLGIVRALRGGVRGRRPFARTRFAAELVATAAAALPASLARTALKHFGSRKARRALEELRDAYGGPEPEAWVGLMPMWARINAHMIHHVADGSPPRLGYVMFDRLGFGSVAERDLKKVHAGGLFDALGPLKPALSESSLDQIAHLESTRALLQVLAKAAVASARAVARLSLRGPTLNLGGEASLELDQDVGAVARLLTMDVVDGVLGDAAARAFLRRHSLEGKPMVLVAALHPGIAAACRRFERNGARVVEYFHGLATGGGSGAASIKCLWTYPEVEERKLLGERAIVAGAPPCPRVPARANPRTPCRALFLSNYAHRDTLRGRKIAPLAAFQEELLEAARLVTELDEPFELRWRPHPADLDEAVRADVARCPGITLARAGSLEDELATADVVIASVSTSIVQALLAGKPVFVHLIPEYQDLHLTRFVAAERGFFRAPELAPKLIDWLRCARAESQAATLPERNALRTLFGPTGHPANLFEAVASLHETATRPSVSSREAAEH